MNGRNVELCSLFLIVRAQQTHHALPGSSWFIH